MMQCRKRLDVATHDAEKVPVSRAHVNLRLDQRLPLLDERAELVAGEVHPVEVGQDRGALDILAAQLHLPVTLKTRGEERREKTNVQTTDKIHPPQRRKKTVRGRA